MRGSVEDSPIPKLAVPGRFLQTRGGPISQHDPNSNSQVGFCPWVSKEGLGQSSWAMGIHPGLCASLKLCRGGGCLLTSRGWGLGHRYTDGSRTRGPGRAEMEMVIQGKHCAGQWGLVPMSLQGCFFQPRSMCTETVHVDALQSQAGLPGRTLGPGCDSLLGTFPALLKTGPEASSTLAQTSLSPSQVPAKGPFWHLIHPDAELGKPIT